MNRAELTAYLAKLDAAADFAAVFGAAPANATAGDAYAALRRSYRRAMRRIHPDRYATQPGLAALATQVAARLNAWLADAETSLGITAAAAPAAPAGARIVEIDGAEVLVGAVLAEGDLCDVHEADPGTGERWVLKLVRDAANNDLVENEAYQLGRIASVAEPDTWAGFAPYLPRLLHTVQLADGRLGNVFPRRAPADRWFSLADVMDAYPRGVDARTIGWIFSRILEALSFLHRTGTFHGAVLPEHVLVQPEDHGATLLDWCYAGKLGSRLGALSARYRSWYPPEVFEREPAGPGLDLALAARTTIAIAGGSPLRGTLPPDHPNELGDILRGCLIPAVDDRYADAFVVYERWRATLRRVFGGIRFHPFAMPPPC